MCLDVTDGPITATDNISCWTVVRVKEGKMLSFYRNDKIEPEMKVDFDPSDSKGEINVGLHSFTTLNDAEFFFERVHESRFRFNF